MEGHGIASPDVFRGEMATLAMHKMLRAKANGWSDIAGANVFDSDAVLINSSKRWPVADVKISDRNYFNRLKNNPTFGRDQGGPGSVRQRACNRIRTPRLRPPWRVSWCRDTRDHAGAARIVLRFDWPLRGIFHRHAPPKRPVDRTHSPCRGDDRARISAKVRLNRGPYSNVPLLPRSSQVPSTARSESSPPEC